MAFPAPFAPSVLNGTVGGGIAVTLNTGAPASNSATMTAPGYANAVQVLNASSLVAFVALVASATYVASSADLPILANSRAIISMPGPGTATLYAYAKPSATLGAAASVYFTPGIGGAGQT